ncbi:MAG: hypothetical protein KF884_09855 [Fimbriimonadaceae bacterium]|nr:hypothetical protein [Fimbriimonadaceae bacterium]QYK57850.1 MAG: hypothetical protein KF884_09855 [Fimbriimonadaceae bacterium]
MGSFLWWFVAGVLVGWLAEWLIDWFWWRQRASGRKSEAEVMVANLRGQVERLTPLEGQVATLQAQLNESVVERQALQAALQAAEESQRRLGDEAAEAATHKKALDECRATCAELLARLEARSEAEAP